MGSSKSITAQKSHHPQTWPPFAEKKRTKAQLTSNKGP